MERQIIENKTVAPKHRRVLDRPLHQLSVDPFLVGREMERAFLENYLDSARDGQGRVVIVSGEAGIGKTGLIKELACQIGNRIEGKILTGVCLRQQRGTPYYPFQEIFSSQRSSIQNKEKSEWTELLESVTPGGLTWDVDPVMDMASKRDGVKDLELARQKMFYNALQFLLNLAKDDPLLVVLEDIHWADTSSLQLLHFLARNISKAKILIVATYDSEEVMSEGTEASPPLTEILKGMGREMLFEKLELQRLSKDETDHLIGWCFPGATFSESFVRSMYMITKGNPYLVRLGLELMLAQGVIVGEKTGWSNSHEIDETSIPSTIQEMVKRRIRPFNDRTRSVLECAATIGERFSPHIISEATGISLPDLFEVFTELEEYHRILHKAGRDYIFDHISIGEVLYRDMCDERRRVIHHRVGDSMEQIQGDGLNGKIYDLAYHFSRGGDDPKALSCLEQAGERARNCLAFQEALDFYRAGLSILERNSSIRERDRRRMHLHLCAGEMDQIVGQWESSMQDFRCSLALAKTLRDQKAEGYALMQLGTVYAKRSSWAEAELLYNQSIRIFRQKGNLEQVGLIMTCLADIDMKRSQWQESEERYKEALHIAMRTVDKRLMARIYSNLGAIADIRGDLMEAILHYSKSLDLYKGLEDFFGIAKVYYKLGMMHASGHKWEKALGFYDKCIDLSEKIGEIGLTSFAYLKKAVASLNMLDLDEVERLCDDAQLHFIRIEDPQGLAECNKVHGLVGAHKNEWHYAQRRFEESIRILESCGDYLELAQNLVEIGNMYAMHGMRKKALESFRQSIDIFTRLGVKSKIEELKIRMNTITPEDTRSKR